jgi:hypothetical protein
VNEDDLLRAHGFSPDDHAGINAPDLVDKAIRRRFYEVDRDLRLEAQGMLKCIEGDCPVQIYLWSGRVLCRYHERKRRETQGRG